MTATDIRLVKRTWQQLQGINPLLFADLFYSKLFTDQPGLKKMFPASMDEQYRKLMDMLNTLVLQLDNTNQLKEVIAAMADRHIVYGVRPQHYQLVGNTLLWTLQRGLGRDWNEATEQAWRKCYSLVAGMMLQVQERRQHKLKSDDQLHS